MSGKSTHDSLAQKLQLAEEGFENMDRCMRLSSVPIAVSQAAFDCGMRYLREARDILATKSTGREQELEKALEEILSECVPDKNGVLALATQLEVVSKIAQKAIEGGAS